MSEKPPIDKAEAAIAVGKHVELDRLVHKVIGFRDPSFILGCLDHHEVGPETRTQITEKPVSCLECASNGLRCSRCGSLGARIGNCPFDADVHNDPHSTCTCCDQCRENCAHDI